MRMLLTFLSVMMIAAGAWRSASFQGPPGARRAGPIGARDSWATNGEEFGTALARRLRLALAPISAALVFGWQLNREFASVCPLS
jgi:hypothetical protein